MKRKYLPANVKRDMERVKKNQQNPEKNQKTKPYAWVVRKVGH